MNDRLASVKIPAKLHVRLKLLAIHSGVNLQELITSMIEDRLANINPLKIKGKAKNR